MKEEKRMVLEDNTRSCKGEFHVELIKNDMVVGRVDDHNLVVDSGRVRLAELSTGTSTNHITHIGVGDGTDAEKASDSTLGHQQLFALEKASVSGRDARFDFVIDNSQANGLKIHEFGLFCADGVMFSHRVRSGVIEKADDITIKGYWILHF